MPAPLERDQPLLDVDPADLDAAAVECNHLSQIVESLSYRTEVVFEELDVARMSWRTWRGDPESDHRLRPGLLAVSELLSQVWPPGAPWRHLAGQLWDTAERLRDAAQSYRENDRLPG